MRKIITAAEFNQTAFSAIKEDTHVSILSEKASWAWLYPYAEIIILSNAADSDEYKKFITKLVDNSQVNKMAKIDTTENLLEDCECYVHNSNPAKVVATYWQILYGAPKCQIISMQLYTLIFYKNLEKCGYSKSQILEKLEKFFESA